MAALFRAALAALVICAHPAAAETVTDLYSAYAQVTGQREETRLPALPQCFRDVVVKVSGDPRLLDDPRTAGLYDESAISGYSYRDLMAHLPKRDEQGTRDRPHELTVSFDPARVDAALAALGSKPWSAERAKLMAFVAVKIGNTAFVLTDSGEPGGLQRQALLAAFRRYGVPVALPSAERVRSSGAAVDSLMNPDQAALNAAARAAGSDLALAGSIVFSDRELGWIADWRLAPAALQSWGTRGVTFDEAFRNAARGAAQVLSGNGDPR